MNSGSASGTAGPTLPNRPARQSPTPASTGSRESPLTRDSNRSNADGSGGHETRASSPPPALCRLSPEPAAAAPRSAARSPSANYDDGPQPSPVSGSPSQPLVRRPTFRRALLVHFSRSADMHARFNSCHPSPHSRDPSLITGSEPARPDATPTPQSTHPSALSATPSSDISLRLQSVHLFPVAHCLAPSWPAS